MQKTAFFFFILMMMMMSATSGTRAQHQAYLLYNKSGNETDFEAMARQLQQADVVLFGELHNNPICHWLQLEVAHALHQSLGDSLVLAAEMFEADDQLVLDEYLSGVIRENHFTTEAKIWNNYQTDYKPLVEFAKDKGLAFVASNIPRRYASLVSRKGREALDSLPDAARQYMMPLPLEADLSLPGYKNMLDMMQGGHGGGMQPENFAYAQAAKDATMAHFILKNRQPGQVVLHFNGAYHSNNFEGIYWYLKQQNPDLQVVTISSVEQQDIGQLTEENTGLADFTIAIPANMTKTY